MRVAPIARNALAALGLGLLSINYAYATAAVLTPAAGQAVQTVNGVRVAAGIARAGYVLGTASVYIAEFGGAVAINVGWRVAAGAAVAATATATIAPLVLGGLALGTAGYYAKEWLDAAHAQGKATDFEYNPATDTIERKAIAGNGFDENATKLSTGETVAQAKAMYNDWLPGACGTNGCTARATPNASSCNNNRTYYSLHNSIGSLVTGWCLDANGAIPLAGTPPSKPTADQWEQLAQQLASIPVNPKLLEQMGKPIPVDPVPAINPPDQTGSQDLPIGVSNPAPTLPSRPLTVTGEAVPVPNTSPQQYTQPTWTITPTNDAANPYGVTITSTSVTTGNPATPTNPSTPIPGTATPSTPDVCAHNPNAAMCQPVGTITDPSMPPIPELYTRKYPDGLVGIWQTKTAAIAQTSMVTSLGQMMPTHLTSGTCPSWTLDLSLGPAWADLGTHEIAPPCWVWDVAKAILIITALMAARRMIFGG